MGPTSRHVLVADSRGTVVQALAHFRLAGMSLDIPKHETARWSIRCRIKQRACQGIVVGCGVYGLPATRSLRTLWWRHQKDETARVKVAQVEEAGAAAARPRRSVELPPGLHPGAPRRRWCRHQA